METKSGGADPIFTTCLMLGVSAQEDFEGTAAFRYAVDLATQPGFELSLYVFAPPVESPAELGSQAALDWIERETSRSEQLTLSTVATSRRLVAEAGISFVAEYAHSRGEDPLPFIHVARVNDVTVLDAGGPDDPSARNAIESALFDSGRPLLVIPLQGAPLAHDCILIAWDGSARAARAVKDALPLLKLSRTVIALTITGEKDLTSMTPGSGLKAYLARHGIGCELVSLSGRPGEVPDIMRTFGAAEGVEMMVMGAFVHSRLREAILGGVTRSFLTDCPWPLFAAH